MKKLVLGPFFQDQVSSNRYASSIDKRRAGAKEPSSKYGNSAGLVTVAPRHGLTILQALGDYDCRSRIDQSQKAHKYTESLPRLWQPRWGGHNRGPTALTGNKNSPETPQLFAELFIPFKPFLFNLLPHLYPNVTPPLPQSYPTLRQSYMKGSLAHSFTHSLTH